MISEVDQTKCCGCGLCFKSCPLDVFRLDTVQHSISPCMKGCPAHSDIRGCHYLIQQGRFSEALALFKKTSPLPAITGRICFHPCEESCTRTLVDESVNINALEQFLGDLDLETEQKPFPVTHLAQVAVVGSGPSGLACAWRLVESGYSVTVFEAMPLPGGMLRYGIPAWRLPDAVLDRQINKLCKAGIRFQCKSRLDEHMNLNALRKQGFKAICLALGASAARMPDLPCEKITNVVSGLEFLSMVRQKAFSVPGHTVVVGGGNVAMDAAVSAMRLGASRVDLICLESQETLPAFGHSVAEAHAVGVCFHYNLGPVSIYSAQGKATSLECQSCLSLTNAQGSFAPKFDNTKKCSFGADTIIMATGQKAEPGCLNKELDWQNGWLRSDPFTGQCSQPGVFAAGDVTKGPSSVIQAIVSGQKSAEAIARYLSGREMHRKPKIDLPLADATAIKLNSSSIPPLPRQKRVLTSLPQNSFAEARAGFGLSQCMAEAMRCLTCGGKARIAYDDDCMTCYSCEVCCPTGAVFVHPFKEPLPSSLNLPEVEL